jgi:hypothetical protein
MKTKKQKYDEAVDRNILNAQRKAREGSKKYSGLTLAKAKNMLGISKADNSEDARVKTLIA